MTHKIDRLTVILCIISLSLAAAGLTSTTSAHAQPAQAQDRIGVYDSRAIAVAYVGSTFQQAKMKELQAFSAKAKAAGDTKEVARLETEGRAWQTKLNQQGFGTAPVDDLLVHIASDLPKIQDSARVTRLISKWDQARLSRSGTSEQIDVTMLLVDAFHPRPEQRKRAIEIQKVKPVKVKE